MDSFELNKIIGALLGVVFVVFSISLISDSLFYSPVPATPGYAIVVPDAPAEAADPADEPESILPLIAAADPAAGESVFRRCQACHTTEEGGQNRVGPNLWDVVGAPIATHEGFSFSGALQEFSEGGERVWDYETLDDFLLDPRGTVPGTIMAFAGLNNIDDRANVIAYLRTLSNDPVPLPEAGDEAEPAQDEAAPAEDEAAPAEDEAATEDEPAAEEAPAAEEETPAADDAATQNGEADGTADEEPEPAE